MRGARRLARAAARRPSGAPARAAGPTARRRACSRGARSRARAWTSWPSTAPSRSSSMPAGDAIPASRWSRRSTASSMPSMRWDTERRRRVSRSTSAAEGMLSAPSAASWACDGALPCLEGARKRRVHERVLEQLLRELAQRVLALAGDPVAKPARGAVVHGSLHRVRSRSAGMGARRGRRAAVKLKLSEPDVRTTFRNCDESPQENASLIVRECTLPHGTDSLNARSKGRSGRRTAVDAQGTWEGPAPGMTGRKLLIALLAAALYAVVLVASASAELHRVQVTLVTGEVIATTVDVPRAARSPPSQIPGLPAAAQSVVDLGPVATPTPEATVPPAPPSRPCPRSRPPSSRRSPTSDAAAAGRRPAAVAAAARRRRQRLELRRREPGQPRDRQCAQRRRPCTDGVRKSARRRGRADAARRRHARPRRTRPSRSPPPGAARIGVPNFFIDKFRVPPFLLPIYQAAGIQYGVRWEILAAINEIETDYGRNLNVSSAGALGWMQFMPATWRAYGVDANGDGKADPYNPVDAIFAAARYLRAAGADTDIRRAVFAYNHADWYVDSVLLRAQVIGGMPAEPRRLAHRPHAGPLPGAGQGHLRGPAQSARRQARPPAATPRWSSSRPTASDIKIFTRGALARGRRQRRQRPARRLEPPARQLRRAPGRLRQHVHLRAPRQRRQALPVAQAAHGQRGRGQARAGAPEARRRARPGRLLDRPPGEQGAEAQAGAQAPRRRAARRPPAAAKQRLFANPARPNSSEAGGAQQEFRAHRRDRRLADLRGLLQPHPRARPRGRRAQAPAPRQPRRGRHRARPDRRPHSTAAPRTCCSRSARRARAPRRSTRSRSSTAGSCSSRRRSTARPARTRSSAATPPTPRSARSCCMSKEALVAPGALQPADRHLRVRPARHPLGPDRPARAGHARVPRRLRPAADGQLAELRPRLLHEGAATSPHHSSGNAVDIAAINGIPITGHPGRRARSPS